MATAEEDAPQDEPPAAEGEERRDLALDQVFELLKNSRRREVLNYFEQLDTEEVAIGELAEHIAAIENDTTVENISSSQRKRVYVGLYQCHLPKMDDMDVVQFNKNRGKITLGPNAPELEEYLGTEEAEVRRWHYGYAAVSVAAAVLFGLSQLSVVPFLTAELVLVAVIAATSVGAVVHAAADRRADD